MSLTIGSRSHLEDAELVRYMDREMEREHLRLARAHLHTCAACAARLEGVQQRASAVSAFLAELDAPVPDEHRALAMAAVERARFRRRAAPAWGGRPLLQAAAAVALLLTLAFGTPPGRAMVGRAADGLGWGGREPATPPPLTPAPDDAGTTTPAVEAPPAADEGVRPLERAAAPRANTLPPGMSPVVPFSPQGNYVLLEFDSRQRAGSAAIWVRASGSANGQVTANLRTERLEVMSDGLHVRNSGASRAEYTINIPTRYRFIRVKIGDEPETVIAVSRARQDWLWTVSLADAEAQD